MIISALCIIGGNALLAFLVSAFIIPHDIIMGGTTGIGIVLSKLFPSVDVSIFVFILNLILLFMGLIFLGKKFFLTTIASSLIYPAFLAVFQRIPGLTTMTDDHLLAALFAGCLMGAALGLVMRVGSSTGGMDILNLILHHKLHIPIAILVYIGDIIIVGGQAIFSSAEKTLLGILVLFLESIILDKVMLVGKTQIRVSVVSEKYEQIRDSLMDDLNAGVTLSLIETGRTQQQQLSVICIIPRRKVYDATVLIQSIDPDAFITIAQVNEVHGRGFTKEREYK